MTNTMRIIYPLKIGTITQVSYDHITISPYQAEAYLDEILEAIAEYNKVSKSEHGLADCIDDKALKAKVYSLYPTVEVIDDELWGVMIAELREVLSEEETAQLLKFVEEQNADGYGEGFEQRPIETPDGKIFVSFYDRSDRYSLRVELA
jgi:hypothetical protein